MYIHSHNASPSDAATLDNPPQDTPNTHGTPAVSRTHRRPSPLAGRDFILLIIGQGVSLFANTMMRIALAMWILDETGSASAFASILAISFIPTILLSPFGGILADRINRRTMMVGLDAISGLAVALAGAWFAARGFSMVVITALLLTFSVLGAFETPAVQAALPQMLRHYGEDALRRGSAVVSQTQQLTSLIPSFLGGILYALFGIIPMTAVAAAGFVCAATVECFIRLGAPNRTYGNAGGAIADSEQGTSSISDAADHTGNAIRRTPSPVEDLKDAIRFLTCEQPALLRMMMLAALINLIVMGLSAVGYPYLIRTALGFDAAVYGIADGLIGVSNLIGLFLAGAMAARLRIRHLSTGLFAIAAAIMPQGVAFIPPVAAATGVWGSLSLLIGGACLSMIAVAFVNLIALPEIQMRTPEDMTGKVMAFVSSLALCAQPIGQMAYGWTFDRLPASAVMLTSAAALAAITAVVAVPAFRRFND